MQEYDQHYTLKDLCDANEALDIIDEHEAWDNKKQEAEIAAKRVT